MSVEEPKVVKGHCPTCKAGRFADVVCSHIKSWNSGELGFGGTRTFNTLSCRGCETVYFQEIRWEALAPDREMVSYWPRPSKRAVPVWMCWLELIQKEVANVMYEVYDALDNDLFILAAIGIRTAFDKASVILGIDSSLTFGQKLTELYNNGKIGLDEKEILSTLIDAGSAAAHRGWKPNLNDLITMMETLEQFIHRSFCLGNFMEGLKSRVPPRAAKGKA